MLLTSSMHVYSTNTIDRSLGTAQNHPGHAIQKALEAYVIHEEYENKTPQVCNRLLACTRLLMCLKTQRGHQELCMHHKDALPLT